MFYSWIKQRQEDKEAPYKRAWVQPSFAGGSRYPWSAAARKRPFRAHRFEVGNFCQ